MADEELFKSVGKQVEGLTISDEQQAQSKDVSDDSKQPASQDEEAAAEERIGDEIESLCMNCHENGTTRLLLTKIPYFREVIIMSFYCPHCHFKNSEVQAAGEIQERGCRSTLRITDLETFSRQVVKSDTCVAKFKELDLEIPAGRGQLTNVEGLLRMTYEDLEFSQPSRRALQPEIYEKIEVVIEKAKKMLEGESFPVTLVIDDPAGNSWIEPSPDNQDGSWSRSEYLRSAAQNEGLALKAYDTRPSEAKPFISTSEEGTSGLPQSDDIIPGEVYTFPAECSACAKPCSTHMKMVDIPHFKQVVIMSVVCDHCGYRSNEVKTGGAIPEKGRQITLKVEKPEDLSRDILKSEFCVLICPELKLHVEPGTLGGRFTTVEGLLTQVRKDLRASIFGDNDAPSKPTEGGDSTKSVYQKKWDAFFEGLDQGINGEKKFTLILKDPLASSYVQNDFAPEADPQIEIEDYERSEEENEDLGLADMNTENYEEPASQDEAEELKPSQ